MGTIEILVLMEVRDFLIAILPVASCLFFETSSFRSCFHVRMPIHRPNSLIKMCPSTKKSLLCPFYFIFRMRIVI